MNESSWAKIARVYEPTQADRDTTELMYREFGSSGYVRMTCRKILELSNAAISQFFILLSREQGSESPVRHFSNSAWMSEADFCFVNPRAAYVDEGPGTFLQAAKLLPTLRASAIHLSPFTVCQFDAVYAILSTRTISPQVVDSALAERGCSAEEQLRAFVDAAHLLGKAIGFDLEPHVTQFALTVFEAPHLFRWIKLSEADRDRLDHGLSYEAMLGAEWQVRLAEDVRRIVRSRLADLGLSELEAREADSADTARLKRQASHELTVELIERGYWTIPLHHWNGVGVPAFVGFDHAARHPRFCYLSRDGCDVSGQTYGVLTPLAFYGGLPANREPDRPPTRNEDAIAFYGRIFTWWRDHFGFDFVRYDYVGNVRETVRDHDSDYAVSDRPTPHVLRQCVRAARSPDKPFVGAFAENLGDEPEAYGEIGFDAILGSDMVGRVDRAHLEKCFRIYERLVGYNRERPTPFAIAYAVDTHDTGEPWIHGAPWLKLLGSTGVLRRLFLARFLNCGMARRPKYEVMGLHDMSYGLTEANVRPTSLTWVGDEAHFCAYHCLEDVYDQFRLFLRSARVVRHRVADDHAWWLITDGLRILAPLLSLEGAGIGHDARDVVIDLDGVGPAGDHFTLGYDFTSAVGRALDGPVQGAIRVDVLPYLAFRLYEVVPGPGPVP